MNIAYKHQGDTKHKDMQSLVGVHIKNEIEEIIDQNTILYPFMLIFTIFTATSFCVFLWIPRFTIPYLPGPRFSFTS